MVAIPALKIVADERAQRIALERTLLLHHVVAFEDVAVELRALAALQLERPLRTRGEVLRDHDVVEEVPRVAIGQRAESRAEHGGEGVEEVARFELLYLRFGTQPLGEAPVGRIVVEVAHRHDLRRGVDLEHRVGDATHLLAHGDALELRGVLAAQTRRPVGHHEEERFVLDLAPHRQDVARLEVGQIRDFGLDRTAALQFEHRRPIEERHIDAARLGRVVVHDPVIGRSELRRRHDILEHRAGLDLRNADHGRIVPVEGRKVEQHAFDVRQFLVIFRRIPLLGPFGRELVVAHLGVVDRVEEVLQVVEHHLVGLLREAHYDERRHQQRKDQSFFHRSAY